MKISYIEKAAGLLLSAVILGAAVLLTIQVLEPDLPWDVPDVSKEPSQETVFTPEGEVSSEEGDSGTPTSAGVEGGAGQAETVPAGQGAEGSSKPAEAAGEPEETGSDSDESYASIAEQAVLIAQRAELEHLSGSEVWDRLSEYDNVYIGDSRVVGFSLYGFVDGGRVLARNGATIDDLSGWIDDARSLHPDNIFIAYGINDIKERLGRNPEGYAEYVQKRVEALQEEVPEAEIFIHSVIPARPFLYSTTPSFGEIDEYNDELRMMCEESGWHFVDNSAIAEEHSGYYANDGIHLGAGFYEYWGKNMLLALFDQEHGFDPDSSSNVSEAGDGESGGGEEYAEDDESSDEEEYAGEEEYSGEDEYAGEDEGSGDENSEE